MNELIIKAFEFGRERHKGQKDDTGEDYFEAHCVEVFMIMSQVASDDNLLCAALLHDTLEDTITTYNDLAETFNQDIADLVNEVTHDGKKDEVGFYFPRLKTKRGILLKFADRLSNLSRMESWDEKRQEHYLKRSKFWKSEAAAK